MDILPISASSGNTPGFSPWKKDMSDVQYVLSHGF